MTKQIYPHFNPEVHKIESKIGIEKEEEYILMAENRLKQTNLDVYGESAEPKFIYDKQIQEVWKNGME